MRCPLRICWTRPLHAVTLVWCCGHGLVLNYTDSRRTDKPLTPSQRLLTAGTVGLLAIAQARHQPHDEALGELERVTVTLAQNLLLFVLCTFGTGQVSQRCGVCPCVRGCMYRCVCIWFLVAKTEFGYPLEQRRTNFVDNEPFTRSSVLANFSARKMPNKKTPPTPPNV